MGKRKKLNLFSAQVIDTPLALSQIRGGAYTSPPADSTQTPMIPITPLTKVDENSDSNGDGKPDDCNYKKDPVLVTFAPVSSMFSMSPMSTSFYMTCM